MFRCASRHPTSHPALCEPSLLATLPEGYDRRLDTLLILLGIPARFDLLILPYFQVLWDDVVRVLAVNHILSRLMQVIEDVRADLTRFFYQPAL